jgi:hypothetical protein
MIADGSYSIEYYSLDLAGNTETANETSVMQDTTVPVTTDPVPAQFINTPAVVLTPSDLISGISQTYYQLLNLSSVPVNTLTITGEVVATFTTSPSDLELANVFVVSGSETVYKDSVPLTSGIDYTIDYDYGILTFLVVLTPGTVTADYVYSVDYANVNSGSSVNVLVEGNYLLRYFSMDNAGNREAVKAASNQIKLDLTPPEITNILPAGLVITDTTTQISFRVQDTGTNPSGIDPFSIRVFVDGIEYSFRKNSQYITMDAVGLSLGDVVNDTTSSVFEVLESFASGGETEYVTTNAPVARNTLVLWKNSEIITMDIDYVLEHNTGIITLLSPLESGDSLEAEYRYVYLYHNTYDVILESGTGPLKSTIPAFDVIDSIVIDPFDLGGNVSIPLTYSFVSADISPPFIELLNPRPQAKDVSIHTNVMFRILDGQSGVDIESVLVTINGTEYRISIDPTILLEYTGTASVASVTISNNNLVIRINGMVDVSLSFLDRNFTTIQQVVNYLDSLSNYTATLLDLTKSQEPGTTMINIRNQDITTASVLSSQFDLERFSYQEFSDGYLVTVFPETDFDNQQNVSVIIEGSDNNGNEMTPIAYSFQTQLGASDAVVRRLQIDSESNLILSRIRERLASNYNTMTQATEFNVFIEILATELARLKIRSEETTQDFFFDFVRDSLLYQNFGVYLDFLPGGSVSHRTYHDYLISILNAFMNGSLVESIESAISLFTDGNVYIRERFNDTSDLSEQFIFDVFVEISSTSKVKSLIDLLNQDLTSILRYLKPAHTFFILGFLFVENIGIDSGCEKIPLIDIFGSPMLDYLGQQRYQYDGSAYILYLNGFPLIEIRDYVINTITGTITLTQSLAAGDRLIIDYKERHDISAETPSVTAGSTFFQTAFYPVVPLTLKVYRNELFLDEGPDYIFDLTNGTITLSDPVLATDIFVLEYSWFSQVLDEILVSSAVGGEISVSTAWAPVVNIRFEAGTRTSDYSACDRYFLQWDITIPYIDFKLNGKPHFFQIEDPDSTLNDVAVLVDTHWTVEDSLMEFALIPA